MSNILIIKHGSLGDIAQISGALQDIRTNHVNEKIFIITTNQYVELLSKCPFIDGVLLDKRLPRWNIFYLLRLKKLIKKYKFSKVYDLQNSSRTSFYRKYLFNISNWCSAEITLKKLKNKNNHKNNSVLERFKTQLESSDVKTKYTMTPDFSWSCINVDKITHKYFGKDFILIFPFCSPKLSHKRWPHYNDLIKIIKSNHQNLEVVLAPGPDEIDLAKNINATVITNGNKPLSIIELSGLIKKSKFVISNDTGPAHMAAHLGKDGLVLFGHHTTPKRVSIETDKFRAIVSDDLKKLSVDEVYSTIKDRI